MEFSGCIYNVPIHLIILCYPARDRSSLPCSLAHYNDNRLTFVYAPFLFPCFEINDIPHHVLHFWQWSRWSCSHSTSNPGMAWSILISLWVRPNVSLITRVTSHNKIQLWLVYTDTVVEQNLYMHLSHTCSYKVWMYYYCFITAQMCSWNTNKRLEHFLPTDALSTHCSCWYNNYYAITYWSLMMTMHTNLGFSQWKSLLSQ